MVDFVARSALIPESPYAKLLQIERTKIEHHADAYLFHEYLEEYNHPLYFHEFAALASAANLRYVGQAEFFIEEFWLSPEARQILSELGTDVIRREQYLDFLLNRSFRHSLLCHAGVLTTGAPSAGAIRLLRMTSKSRPENPGIAIHNDAKEPFLTFQNDRLLVDEPVLKAALVILLRRWPRSMVFSDLWAATLDLLGRSHDTAEFDSNAFATSLLEAHIMRLVDLHTFDPPIATELDERPRVGSMARRDAARGGRVISLRNHYAALAEIDRLVLPLMDGSRDQDGIIDELTSAIELGTLNFKLDGKPITETDSIRVALAQVVKSSLERIASQALLLSDYRKQ